MKNFSYDKPISTAGLIFEDQNCFESTFWFHRAGVGMQRKLKQRVVAYPLLSSTWVRYLSTTNNNRWVLFTTWSNWSDFKLHPYLAHPVFSMYLQEWQKLFIQSYSYPRIMCMLCVAFMLDECVFRNIYSITNTNSLCHKIQWNKQNNIL